MESSYRWNGIDLEAVSTRPVAPVVAADSWLVRDGHTVALEQHVARFSAAAGAPPNDFWKHVVQKIPHDGDWFPRVERLAEDESDELYVTLRPAPQRTQTATVWTAPEDPRLTPAVKGPDLLRLGTLREQAQQHGADEALVLAGGYVAEGAYSTVLAWWEERGEVWSLDAPRVPSVTEQVVLELCRARGLSTRLVAATPTDLAGAELWILSALHGLRHVTQWVEGPPVASVSALHRELQEEWWGSAVPL